MKTRFNFIRPGKLVDRDLELVLVKTAPADPAKGYVPGYEFEMRPQRTCAIIGAKYVETVRIPKNHEMYKQGARYRRRYRLTPCRRMSRKCPFGSVSG